MNESLLLVVIVAVSYLAAHVVFDRLARRFTIVSGAEYLLLGIVLGPQVSGLLAPDIIDSFSPLVTLGLGWIGTLTGAQLLLRGLVRVPAVTYRVAMAEAVLSGTVLWGALFGVLHWGLELRVETATIAAAALALVGILSSSAGVRVFSVGTSVPIVRQLEVAVSLQAVLASAGLALLFALRHDTPAGLPRALVPTEWMAITIAIGVVGGVLFHVFVGDERKIDRLFISLAGAIILVSGAAAALRLSPVFAALVFGAILANTSTSRAELTAALRRVERPFQFVLLLFAGAIWQPSTYAAWLLPVAAFVSVRLLVRPGAARLAARTNGMLPALGPAWGRGLLGHGGFSLVLGLDYLRQGSMPSPNVVFTAIVASVLLTDVASARLVRGAIVSSGTPLPGTLPAVGGAQPAAVSTEVPKDEPPPSPSEEAVSAGGRA
jgi:Kef-type K+ transport system membrane component KefB